MDRMLYVAMTGAKHTFGRQEIIAHNLANVSTPGYRAQESAFRVVPLVGPGNPTRAFVLDSTPHADFTQGNIEQTGNNLDIALRGPGFFAVQTKDGSEAFTRNGGLTLSLDGVLQTRAGLPVTGDSGSITVPPNTQVQIADDGTVSATAPGQQPIQVGRIRLVNPPTDTIVRGDDGLFRSTASQRRTTSGALDGRSVPAPRLSPSC